jgi:diguanylate cyclase
MGGFHVSISAGIVQMEDNEALADTMQRADAALLVAKQAGKNRVVAS